MVSIAHIHARGSTNRRNLKHVNNGNGMVNHIKLEAVLTFIHHADRAAD